MGSAKYPVDQEVRTSLRAGTLHEWTVYELRAILRLHGIKVRGQNKGIILSFVGAIWGKAGPFAEGHRLLCLTLLLALFPLLCHCLQ